MKRITRILLTAALLLTLMPVARSAQVEHFLAADRLYQLGLISGTGTDASGKPLFELDRAPTRSEAITVLVKLLGKADEASKGGWQMPFTDVPDWAKNFVGYAYANGLTAGTSATTFGGNDPVTAAQYITFVLKALGYSATGDFEWDKAWELSDKLGFTDGRYKAGNAAFLRGDVFLISEVALDVKLKDSEQTLAEKLMAAGVFDRAVYESTASGAGEQPSTQQPDTSNPGTTGGQSGLSAEQVYAKCAPTVFVVEALDSGHSVVNRGSGFFLTESGVGVTNFHVLENATAGRIIPDNGGRPVDIEYIYDYDVMEDWVVFQVSGSGYPSAELAETAKVAGGATVYAVGNPLGEVCTITQGIVSNPDRVEQGLRYIQTTASISAGSSGGILADNMGRVIGITSNSYINGQNLNLALPISVLDGYSTKAKLGFSVLIRHDSGGSFDITHQHGSDTLQAQAYYQLQNYVLNNWNHSISGDMAYQTTRVIDDVRADCQLVYMDYEPSEALPLGSTVLVRVECAGKGDTTCVLIVWLDPNTTNFYMYYYVYDNYWGNKLFYGCRPINGTFKKGESVPFITHEGDTGYMAHGAKFSNVMTATGLLMAHEVLMEATGGKYGVEAFGFNLTALQ